MIILTRSPGFLLRWNPAARACSACVSTGTALPRWQVLLVRALSDSTLYAGYELSGRVVQPSPKDCSLPGESRAGCSGMDHTTCVDCEKDRNARRFVQLPNAVVVVQEGRANGKMLPEC